MFLSKVIQDFYKNITNFKLIEVRHIWRVSLVCALCVFVEQAWIKADSPGWIIFSAFTCVQLSVGATIRKSRQRLVGTCLSCIFVFVLNAFFPDSYVLYVFILLMFIFIAMYYVLSYTYYVIFFTTAALMIYLIIYPNATYYILLRLKDVAIGVLFGTVGSIVLWPDFAKRYFQISLEFNSNQLNELFRLVHAWIHGLEPVEKILAQKEECANQNQNARDKIIEIKHELIKRKVSTLDFENFIWFQERILYIVLMIFNSIRYNHSEDKNAIFNLDLLKEIYEIGLRKFNLARRGKSAPGSHGQLEEMEQIQIEIAKLTERVKESYSGKVNELHTLFECLLTSFSK